MEITVDDVLGLKTAKERMEYYERIHLPKVRKEIDLWCRERNINDWEKHSKIYFYINHYHVCGFYPEKSRCTDPSLGKCMAALSLRISLPLSEEDFKYEREKLILHLHLNSYEDNVGV